MKHFRGGVRDIETAKHLKANSTDPFSEAGKFENLAPKSPRTLRATNDAQTFKKQFN
jgi:hypothetical protein